MACTIERDRLSAYHDGELEPAERSELEAHLRECAECVEELEAVRSVSQTLRRAGRVRAPEGLDRAIESSGAPPGPRIVSIRRWTEGALALAAAALIAVSVVVVSSSSRRASEPAGVGGIGMAPRSEPALRAADRRDAALDRELERSPAAPSLSEPARAGAKAGLESPAAAAPKPAEQPVGKEEEEDAAEWEEAPPAMLFAVLAGDPASADEAVRTTLKDMALDYRRRGDGWEADLPLSRVEEFSDGLALRDLQVVSDMWEQDALEALSQEAGRRNETRKFEAGKVAQGALAKARPGEGGYRDQLREKDDTPGVGGGRALDERLKRARSADDAAEGAPPPAAERAAEEAPPQGAREKGQTPEEAERMGPVVRIRVYLLPNEFVERLQKLPTRDE